MHWFTDTKKYYIYRGLNKRFVLPIWVLIMLDSGLSLQEIAVIAGASAIVGFILEVPSGSVADSIGHKQSLIIAAIGQGASMLFFLGGTFWWIAAGSVGYFAIGSLMTGTHQALLFERLKEQGAEKTYRKIQGRARAFADAWSMSSIVFAGFLYAINPQLPFVIGACLFFVGGVVISQFTAAKQLVSVEQREGFATLFAHWSVAIKTLMHHKPLFMLTGTNALIFGAGLAITEFHQVIFSNIGLAAGLFGVFYALKRFTSVLLSPHIHNLSAKFTPPMAVSITGVLTVCYLIFVGFTSNHIAMAFLILLPTCAFLITELVIEDFQNQLIPTGSRATTLSFGNMLNNSSKLLVIAAIGILSSTISIEYSHVLIGIALGCLLFILLPLTHRTFAKIY